MDKREKRRFAHYQAMDGEHYRIETEYHRELRTMEYGWSVSVMHVAGMGSGYPRLEDQDGYSTEAAALAYAVACIEGWNSGASEAFAERKREYDQAVSDLHARLRAEGK